MDDLRYGNDTFVQKQYGLQPPFAGFLPGIAGERGIPLWCYTCNRGQGIAGFGLRDKDHAVMEFSPAHRAYRDVRYRGFRTFIRDGAGSVTEAFTDEQGTMMVRPNELAICWENGLYRTEAIYYIVPFLRLGALARQVRVTNISGCRQHLTVLDGLPEVVCAGVGQDALKNMTQLARAWMQVEDSGRDGSRRGHSTVMVVMAAATASLKFCRAVSRSISPRS